MDIDKLRGELEIDEGICHHVYLDHLGYPTFGIGHLIVEGDPEYPGTEGEPVSPDRVIEAFEADLEGVLLDCKKLYVDFDELPEEAQHIIANMMFNMGLTRLSKFKGMKRGVDNRDWNQAADEMVDSRWYEQVTNRANRLVDRMRNIEHS
jgi:lysozyme|tara:strand:+ start:375 stop:824 length:450 start_codon:yes stop_codon:yes gene_type:complete